LVSYIEKYHLDTMVNSVVWRVRDNTAEVKFVSMINSTAGVIYFPINLEDSEFGIYDTSSLLKLLSIMKDDLSISLIKEHGIYMKMQVMDDVYEGSFSLADIKSIEEAPVVEEPKVFEVSFVLDKPFKEQYLKAYKALGSINRFTIQTTSKDVKITVGNKESYANKVSFNKECDDFLPLSGAKSFSGDAVAEILKANNDFTSGLLEVSSEGLMKISINNDFYSVNYYLIELEEV
jgi:hypothetical protein